MLRQLLHMHVINGGEPQGGDRSFICNKGQGFAFCGSTVMMETPYPLSNIFKPFYSWTDHG